MSFANILKSLMEENNLTQMALARGIGFSQRTVSAWVNGESEPSESGIRSTANFFKVSTDYLLGTGEYWTTTPTAPQLSAEDKNLLSAYHGLERPLQSLLWDMIRTWQKNSASSSEEAPKKKA